MTNSQRVPTTTPSISRIVACGLVIAVAALGAGCSDEPGDDTTASAGQSQAVKFSQCMRDNGVAEFPDPDASGELTIDGVVNGSSLDTEGAAWQNAMAACEDLQPPGFTGDENVTDDEQALRLEFADCMRENGVADFPDPGRDDPLVDTRRIPSSGTEAGMTTLNAAMQTCGDLAEAAIGR
jgi:hypothetical protein